MPVTENGVTCVTESGEKSSPSVAPDFRPKLKALTTLRFLAALHVVLFHMKVTGILGGGPRLYRNFAGIGYVGVNCFFVLSGFILVYTYADSLRSAWRFWQARFARIYPAYVFSLLVSAPFFFFAVRHLELPFFAWSKEHLPGACLLTLSLLQSWVPRAALTWNSVCWSLSVEAFFYLVFPMLLTWTEGLPSSKFVWGMLCWSFVSLSLSLLYLFLHPDGIDKINSPDTTLLWKNILSFNPLARLPEFLVGVFAGRLFLASRNNVKLAAPLIFGGVLVLGTMVVVAGKIPTTLISAGFLSPAFAAIVYGLALQPKWAAFLEMPGLVLLGDASYSLYLLHSIVIGKAFDAMSIWPWGLRAALSLVAAVAASLASYYLVEEPGRRFLRPRRER
jgi:peptidoglycan/LPS O-acetylase OafA/YrhL